MITLKKNSYDVNRRCLRHIPNYDDFSWLLSILNIYFFTCCLSFFSISLQLKNVKVVFFSKRGKIVISILKVG